MKRKFTKTAQVKSFLNEIVTNSSEKFVQTITEQFYKDSEEYTYAESHEMYKSGARFSDFAQGIVSEKTPYVRRRYYEGGNPGAKSPSKAGTHWFERCFNDYKTDYEKQYDEILKQTKKKV